MKTSCASGERTPPPSSTDAAPSAVIAASSSATTATTLAGDTDGPTMSSLPEVNTLEAPWLLEEGKQDVDDAIQQRQHLLFFHEPNATLTSTITTTTTTTTRTGDRRNDNEADDNAKGMGVPSRSKWINLRMAMIALFVIAAIILANTDALASRRPSTPLTLMMVMASPISNAVPLVSTVTFKAIASKLLQTIMSPTTTIAATSAQPAASSSIVISTGPTTTVDSPASLKSITEYSFTAPIDNSKPTIMTPLSAAEPYTMVATAHQTTKTSFLEMYRAILLFWCVSSVEDLYNTSSPQYQALDWLANHDEAKPEVKSIEFLHRYILATFYYSTNGAGKRGYFSFLSSSSICDWNFYHSLAGISGGVYCNPLKIDIRGENVLVGTIPAELGKLARLDSLILASNGLVGTIPTELGQLVELTELFLTSNGLVGTIPTELGQLVELTALALRCSGLEGTIPTELGSLTMLTFLGVGPGEFDGNIPTELGSLTMLKLLVFSDNNGLVGTIPTELGQLDMLECLYLGNNSIVGTIPTELGQLTMLKALKLFGNNGLVGTIPTELGQLTMLIVLNLFGNNGLVGTIPTELSQLTKLNFLCLGNMDLVETIPAELGLLTLLYAWDLDNNGRVVNFQPTVLPTLVPHNDSLVTNKQLIVLTALVLPMNDRSGEISTVLSYLF